MPLAAGARLGPYEVLGMIGAGGMGEVYKARDTRLDRTVAIKVLPADWAADTDRRRRFEQEAKVVAALNHPNIVTIHAIEEADGRVFLAMELVEGRTLADLIPTKGLPLGQVLALAIPLADAVDAAHQKGITHRDLKPTNVMVTSEGRLKVLDFGLAKLRHEAPVDQNTTIAARLTGEGRVVGTIAYMSPEQAEGRPVDLRSDIFSLGVILYEMATGERPFKGDTGMSILSAILRDTPPLASDVNPAVPRELGRVIRRCLTKDREHRYQGAKEVRNELEELKQESASGELARVQTATSKPVIRTETARLRSWLLVVAVLALVVSGATGVWLWRNHRPNAPPLAATHMQVTFSGNVSVAALSPDGQTIAYAVRTTGQTVRVMVHDLGGGQPLQVWEGVFVTALRWTPDGIHVLVAGKPTGEEPASVQLVPRLGGAGRRVAGQVAPFLAISPDGTSVASTYVNGPDVQVARLDGTTQLRIPLPKFKWISALEWSPTTNRLAVATLGDDQTHTIWTFLPDGEGLRRIYSQQGGELRACWSRSTDVLYLQRNSVGTSEFLRLSTTSVNGAEPELLLSGPQASGPCQVSSDGERLLHVRQTLEANLFRVALESRGASPAAITQGTWTLNSPGVSPDGRWICAERGGEIIKIPINGGEPTRLTHGSAASWSPDGRQLAFVSLRDGRASVWVGDAEGLQAHEVPGAESAMVTWFPGPQLAWRTRDARDFRIRDLATGHEESLVRDPSVGYVFEPHVSPKGDQVAVYWNRGKVPGLWLLSWPARVERFVGPNLVPFGWSEDGWWIYAFGAQTPTVVRVAVKTGAVEPVAHFAAGLLGSGGSGCDLTPDRRAAICSPMIKKTDAWIIDHFDPRVALSKR